MDLDFDPDDPNFFDDEPYDEDDVFIRTLWTVRHPHVTPVVGVGQPRRGPALWLATSGSLRAAGVALAWTCVAAAPPKRATGRPSLVGDPGSTPDCPGAWRPEDQAASSVASPARQPQLVSPPAWMAVRDRRTLRRRFARYRGR